MPESRASKVKEYVIEKISKDRLQDPGHGLDHILRVHDAGVQIGLEENANMEILEPALLLHDIIRPTKEKEKEHALASANHAREILPSFSYSKEEIDAVAYAILMHSRSSKQEGAKTLEAKIVYDADKQDGLGHAGMARVLLLCGARGYDLYQTAIWCLGRIIDVVKNEPLYTQAGKRMANEKLKFSLEFCRKVLQKDYDEILYKELGSLEVRL
jgi:uncharacterized protein